MKKHFDSSNIVKIVILVFCALNIFALYFLLKLDAKANSATQSLSYDISEEAASPEESDSQYSAPLLTLDESLIPELTEDDLYDLKNVLIKAQALTAVDGQGNDISEKIIWSLVPVADTSGSFDATFSVTDDARRSSGASVVVSTDLTSPFLMLTDSHVTVPMYSDFSISDYLSVAIDVDGSDLTEYVTTDDYVDTNSAGTYSITIYVYSRHVDSMTRKELTVTVQ